MPMFGGETSSEYGYLIEIGDPKTPQYLCIETKEERGVCYYWSQDAFNALRFARMIDAEQFLVFLSLPETRAVEHCFVVDDPVEE